MKKWMILTMMLFCMAFYSSLNAGTDFPVVEMASSQLESDDPDEPPFYSYSGTIAWYGDEGIALFYSPEGGGNFWVREAPYLLTVTTSNNVTIARLDKNEWINRGCPTYLSFSLFIGYHFAGEIELFIPYPDN